MLRKCSRLLAAFMAAALVITTFGSDFSNARALAAEDEVAEEIQNEGSSDGIVTVDWEKVPESDGDNAQNSEEVAAAETSENVQGEDEQNDGSSSENTDETGAETFAENGETTNGTEIAAGTEGRDAATDAASEDITSDETGADASADAVSLEASETDAKELSESADEKKASEEENAEYPAQSFAGSVSEMNVSVEAEEGAFPKGTQMKLSAISEAQAVSAAADALDGEVKAAKGVDISFADAEGKEIEPKGAVRVSISLANALEGENFSVVHLDDSGNAEKVANASESGADFTAESFSVYIVAGSGDSGADHDDQKAIATYNFHVNDTLFDTRLVKKGDDLPNPGIPAVDSDNNEVFLGWFEKKADGTFADEPFAFGTVGDVEAGKTYDIYAKVETTYYLTFIGLEGEIFHVKKVVATNDESTVVDISDIGVSDEKRYETSENKRFIGWSLTSGITVTSSSDPAILKEVDVAKVDTVYAVQCSYVWISFDENVGNSYSGVSYTMPVMATYDSSAVEPAKPTRPQYDFVCWCTDKEGNNPYDWSTVIGSTAETQNDFTLYAKWKEKEDTTYTVVVWQQNLDGSTFDYFKTFTNIAGKTGAKVDEALLTDYLDLNEKYKDLKYFEYDSSRKEFEVGSTETGSFAKYPAGEEKLSVNQDTIVNLYYVRKEMTINFYENVGDTTPVKTLKGLYEQPIDKGQWPTDEVVWQFYKDGDEKPWDMDFIERYILDKYTDGTVLNLYKFVGDDKTKVIFHFLKETLDGDYEEERIIVHTTGENVDKDGNKTGKRYKIAVENYYLGFEPSFYNTSGDASDNENKIREGSIIEGVTSHDDSQQVYLYFDRVTRSLVFQDSYYGKTSDVPVDAAYADMYENILFEQDLSKPEYKANTPKAEVLASKAASRPGYELVTDGEGNIIWYIDQTGQTPYEWNDTMPLHNKVLYTHWKPVTCNVKLIANGGTINGDDDFDVPYGNKLDRAFYNNDDKNTGKVYRDGYELVGWFYENRSNTPYEFGAITEDIVLVAHWRNPGKVVVKYDAAPHGSGEPIDKYSYAVKSSVVVGAPPTSVEDKYVFIGWTIENDPNGIVYYPDNCFDIKDEYIQNTAGTNTIILKALYDTVSGDGPEAEFTTITYHSNFGTDLTVTVVNGADGKLRVNETVTALSETDCGFNRPGYRFVGWSKKSGENNYPVFVLPGEKIAADNDGIPNDVYAIWEFVPDTPPGPPSTPPTDPPAPPTTPSDPGTPTDPPVAPPTTPSVTGQAVLGERRALTQGDGRAVLGARRSRTEDTTDVTGRIVVIILAGIAAAGILATYRKKEEE